MTVPLFLVFQQQIQVSVVIHQSTLSFSDELY